MMRKILGKYCSIWGLEDLKVKRNEVQLIIEQEEYEKREIEKDIRDLQDKLSRLNKNLESNRRCYESYDKTIKETENGFKKILESSQALLHLAQHEAGKLDGSS